MKKLLISFLILVSTSSFSATNCSVSYEFGNDLSAFTHEAAGHLSFSKKILKQKGYEVMTNSSNTDFTLKAEVVTNMGALPVVVRNIKVNASLSAGNNLDPIAQASASKKFLFANEAIGSKVFKVADKAIEKLTKSIPTCKPD